LKKRQLDKPGNSEVLAFVKQVATLPVVKPRPKRGRLIFALDATASREHTWDQACHLQGQMFSSAAAVGGPDHGLDIQVCYYRGFAEFDHSAWCHSTEALADYMRQVFCVGGQTQIGKVLHHGVTQAKTTTINALVFVGDCVEEDPKGLQQLAGQLALYNVPLFIFQEGTESHARQVFQSLSRITGGAYCSFDHGSAEQLRRLLEAVSVFASGGIQALEDYNARFSRPVLP
jgi:hypothetical protein